MRAGLCAVFKAKRIAKPFGFPSSVFEVVFELRPIADLGPRIISQGRTAPGAWHFGEHIPLVPRPPFNLVVAANVALEHDKHARTDVLGVRSLPAFRLVIPQPRLGLVLLEHLPDANEGDRAAFLRGIQRRTVEVIAARRAVA